MIFHQSRLNTPSLFIPISLGLQAVFLNTLSLRPAENKLACTRHTSTKVTGTIHVYWFSPLTAIHFPALFLQMINRWHRSNMMPGLCRVQYRFFSLLIYTSKDVNVLQCLLWVYKTRTTCKNKSPVRNCFKYSVHCLHNLLLWKWDRLKAQVFKTNLDKLLFDWNFVYKVRCVYIQSINHYKDSRFCTKRLHLWRHDDLKKWIYMLIE